MRFRLLALAVVLMAPGLLGACGQGSPDEVTEPSPTAPPAFQGHELSEPLPKPDFVLTDTSGKAFDFQEETEGYVTLLYFGYTHCPDICPSHMADVAAVIERNPDLTEHVKVVFVTVDPLRDTPDRLRMWLDLFNEDFIGLTGSNEEIEVATKDALRGRWFPIETAAFGDGDYSVSHAAFVIAYGHDGPAKVIWPFGTQQSEYENDLRILVKEGLSHES